MQISLWRRVAGHPRMVFEKVADIAHWPQMVRSITNVAIVDLGPIREGTRIIETRFMFGREVTEELLVTDFKRPRRLRVAVQTTTLLCERPSCRRDGWRRLPPDIGLSRPTDVADR
jgi:hypothetical protein